MDLFDRIKAARDDHAIGLPVKGKYVPFPTITDPTHTGFVVHHHEAEKSGPHYDLRIQLPETTVGASWAIPKAKLPEPGERVLAVRQGDHRTSYFDFEGSILEGYGKGNVSIAHKGPVEIVDSRPDMVRFGLYNTRTPQEYLLRQTKGDNWVLMNTTPRRDKIKIPEGKYPYREIKPEKHRVDDADATHEAKIDGAHTIMVLDKGKRPRVFSYRRPKTGPTGLIEHSQKLMHWDQRVPTELDRTVLRGETWGKQKGENKPLRPEVISGLLNSNVWKSRQQQEQTGKLKFSPFDVVRYQGKNVEDKPRPEREEIIKNIARQMKLELPASAKTPSAKQKLWETIQAGKHPQTQEGVVQWRDYPTKIKLRSDYDGKITGFFPAEPGSKYHGKAVGGFLVSHDGTTSRVGTGLSDSLRKEMHSHPDRFLGLTATVSAQEKFRSGKLRAPSFMRFHIDKNVPEQLDKIQAIKGQVKAAEAAKTKLKTKLKPHQQRVVDRLMQADQPGLVAAHPLGSGKTLTSIAAAQRLAMPTQAIVPAALQENYAKELKKHVEGELPVDIISQQKLTRGGSESIHPGGLQVLDEAHRARNFDTLLGKTLRKIPAEKRLLMTASPLYNHPSDIAIPINLAAGDKIMPENPREFRDRYIQETKVDPGWLSKLLTDAKPGVRYSVNPHRKKELQSIFGKYIDYVPPMTEGYPSQIDETINVDMTPKQEDYYKAIMGSAPSWVRYKIRKGLPPSKQEAKQLNVYLTGVRQLSNTTRAFQTEGEEYAPKIDTAESELRKMLKSNPQGKAVIYSNYLESGINPYKERLEKNNIPYGTFTGGMSRKQRKQLVEDYNTGKIKALLLSSAGGEGLDLKGTRLMQILDPHFNNEKLRQVIGRGVRYKSHEGLPEKDQNVRVQKFLTRHPEPGGFRRFFGAKRPKSVDEYLTMMSADKDALHQQFREIIDQAQQDVNKRYPAEKAAGLLSRVEESVEEITKQAAASPTASMAKSLKKVTSDERLWTKRPALIGKANTGKRRLMDPGTENNSRRLAKALL